jgi:drug/metabolite transporter (DMT)-like permease
LGQFRFGRGLKGVELSALTIPLKGYPLTPRADKLLPAVMILFAGIILFDMMGLIIKHLSPEYRAAELSAYRNLFGLIPSALALVWSPSWRRNGSSLRLRQWRLAVFRGVCVTFAQFSFYLSLGAMAFASATTISYAMALFMTAFAVPILGEKVGPIRWMAVCIGFGGVILVMNPGSDTFQWIAVLPLIAAAFYAIAGITSRLLDDDAPSALLNLYSSAVSAVGAITLTIATGGFSTMQSVQHFGLIAAMGAFGGAAVLCWVIAHRQTEQSNLAPFNYFGIPLAFALGWLFFGEAPFDDLFPGALLIAAGGLLILWREQRRGCSNGG